jgi:uncharacterized membrane protein YccC
MDKKLINALGCLLLAISIGLLILHFIRPTVSIAGAAVTVVFAAAALIAAAARGK